MHMTDVLLSPVVGGAMTAVTATAVGYSAKRMTGEGMDDSKIPMMGVMGAFVFAAQMINFTIPGTGSSGHIGGGILLAALLGPHAALLALSSVLLIQCLFFADGGLLALGCNIFNIGVCSCWLAYGLAYKPILKKGVTKNKLAAASIISVVIALQAGAFSVVAETALSGVTELPFTPFVALMQPIHLAIGLVEGVITAAVLCFIHNARPELLNSVNSTAATANAVNKKTVIIIFAMALFIGGVLSLFASTQPDGLEWSIERTAGADSAADTSGTEGKFVLMPDYTFAGDGEGSPLGTSVAGMAGSVITVVLAGGVGFLIYAVKKKRQ